MNKNNAKTFKGYWFLPSQPDNKIAGILEVEDFKSFRLDLIGSFNTDLKLFDTSRAEKVIFGTVYNEDNHLREVTLFNCSFSFIKNFSAEHLLTKYNCHYFIDGMHLESMESKSFYKICSNFSNLYDWKPAGIIKQSFFYPKQEESANKPEKIEIKAKTKNNWEIPVEIEKGLQIILYGTVNYNSTSNYEKINIGQNTLFRIEADSNQSITDFLLKLRLFRQFISLGTLSNIAYKKIWLYDRQNFQEIKRGEKYENAVYLYFCYYGCEDDIKKYNRNNLIYSYSDIEKDYPQLIKKWFNADKDFIPIREHLIESINTNKYFTSKDFLILIQAIEGYHTRFINKNNCDLKDRLKDLVENKFKDVAKVGKISNLDIEIIKDSRHYYSHLFKSKKKVADGIELLELSVKLRNLLICCVLNLVGLRNNKINELLNKNQNS